MMTLERVRPLTVAQYHTMGEAGIFAPDERVELIEGVIHTMAPIGAVHAWTVNQGAKALMVTLGNAYVVAVQNPISLSDISEPQPDVSVVRPLQKGAKPQNPRAGDVYLLVEVSDTTLNFDRAVKVPLYAAAAIPEVWVIDTTGYLIEQYRTPSGGVYQEIRRWRKGQSIPTTLGVTVPVDDMLV